MNWSSFEEARDAIDGMSFEELEATSGKQKPDFLPYAPLALFLGMVLFLPNFLGFLGNSKASSTGWLLLLALAFGLYGAIAMTMNGNRGRVYRQDVYRGFVHQEAANQIEENETESDA